MSPARRLAYSIGAPLHGLGIAQVAREGILGLHQAGLLGTVVAPGLTDPALQGLAGEGVAVRTVGGRWLGRVRPEWLSRALFDRLAARRLSAPTPDGGGPPAALYAWAQYSLLQARRARTLGARVALDRGSAEAGVQADILREAYQASGVDYAGPDAYDVDRGRAETATADLVAVPSRYVYDTYVQAGVPPERLWVNPLGVDLDRYRPAKAPPTGATRFLFVGTVGVRKGVVQLLDAWVRARPGQAELVLLGGVLPEVRGRVAALTGQTPDRGVRVEGFATDPAPAYAAAHALVLPSWEDGFGLVVLEAMAAGLPVVVSDRTGAAECVTHGEDGLVVHAGDVDGLAQALCHLAEDRDRTAAMGLAARRKAETLPWSGYRRRLAERLAPWCAAGCTP